MFELLGSPRDDIALLQPGGRGCSYADVLETLCRNRDRLRSLGPRCRILTVLPDAPSTALAIAAICEEATAVPANPTLTSVELERLARESGAEAVVTGPDTDDIGARLAASLDLGHLRVEAHETGHFADFDFQIAATPRSTPPRDGAREADIAVILSTSGSTGTPKLVPLSPGNLTASARTIAETLELGVHDTCLHALPMFHIGPVVDLFLAPLLAGGRVCLAHGQSPRGMIDAIVEAQATWLQGVPTQLYAMIGAASADTLLETGRSLRFIRSVSADLPASRQAEIERSFGGVPVVQMYGMTETAGQICSNGLTSEGRKPGSVGMVRGPEVALLDRFGNRVPAGGDGEVCVRGPSVMAGYLNADRREHFFAEWLRTGDLGSFDEDGFLFLKGRIKDMINRGGEKIPALEIERCALSVEGVKEAACVPVGHPTLGEEVGLAVVPAPQTTLSADAVRAAMAETLAAFKLPKSVLLLETLPKLGSGKVDKGALTALFDPTGARDAGDGPTTERGRLVADIWMRCLSAPSPAREDDFFDAGGDSLRAQIFMMELEEALGRALPSNLLYDAPSFGELEAALDTLDDGPAPASEETDLPEAVLTAARRGMAGWRGARRGRHSLIVELNGAGNKRPFFFCTPTQDSFVDLHAALDDDRPFCAMRTLWLQEGQTPENETKLARHYAKEIRDRQPEGYILLGGHCRGVVMARMIAGALRELGSRVGLLVEFDYPVREVYAGPVAQIWSNDHPLSWEYTQPERWIDHYYTGPVFRYQFDVPHSSISRAETAVKVAGILDPLLDDVPIGAEPASDSLEEKQARLDARRQAHAARISLKTPRFGSAGETIEVRATVTNSSDTTWLPTRESGLRLIARWQRPGGSLLRYIAGFGDLERSVAPGESVEVTFPVRFHDSSTPLTLFADMVEEGVGWFHETAGEPARRRVVPSYWRKLDHYRNRLTEKYGR